METHTDPKKSETKRPIFPFRPQQQPNGTKPTWWESRARDGVQSTIVKTNQRPRDDNFMETNETGKEDNTALKEISYHMLYTDNSICCSMHQ